MSSLSGDNPSVLPHWRAAGLTCGNPGGTWWRKAAHSHTSSGSGTVSLCASRWSAGSSGRSSSRGNPRTRCAQRPDAPGGGSGQGRGGAESMSAGARLPGRGATLGERAGDPEGRLHMAGRGPVQLSKFNTVYTKGHFVLFVFTCHSGAK